MTKYIAAYDTGGTRNRVAIISDKNKIIDQLAVDTAKSHTAIAKQCQKLLDDLLKKNDLKKSQIKSIGMSLAAGINKSGRIIQMPNVRLKKGIKANEFFTRTLGMPVYVLNDMKAAALGELHFGLGKNKKSFMCLTISTGVGSGIVIDGKVVFGANGIAGEVGAMFTDPSKDFESAASGTAIEREFHRITKRLHLSAGEVQRLAESGNKAALRVFKENGRAIGFGLVNIINTVDPEIIIAYGSHFLKGWNLIMPEAKKIIKKHALTQTPIIKTRLGSNAAFLGSAMWAKMNRHAS